MFSKLAGSGTTILAAEQTGRRAAAIEIDPKYVDLAIRRWAAVSGEKAVLAGSGGTFEMAKRIRQEPRRMLPAPASEGRAP